VFVQDQLGRCGFLDVLEEAAVRRSRVTLHLSDDTEVSGTVVDVVTREGVDWIVLEDGSRLDSSRIVWLQHTPRTPPVYV
jgi:hypothetical protein